MTSVNLSHTMTSSNGNIFRVTGPLCGEFNGPGETPTQRPVTRSFDVFFDLRLNKRLIDNREAGDLRRYRGHYDVNVMIYPYISIAATGTSAIGLRCWRQRAKPERLSRYLKLRNPDLYSNLNLVLRHHIASPGHNELRRTMISCIHL